MTSVWLRLLALGGRTMIRPLFHYSTNPARDAERLDRLARISAIYPPFTLRLERQLGGRPALWIERAGSRADRVILYFHGGGYFAGSPHTHAPMLARLSAYARVPVFAQDYRLSKNAPFPAAFEDAVAAWDDLLARGYAPERIVIGGDSAGGGLALALLAYVTQRGERPAGLFAMSPWTDLTLSGASIAANALRDSVLPAARIGEACSHYLNGAAADDPRASPLFATFDAPPPVLFHIGSPEILEDDTHRMAGHLRASGCDVTVRTWEGAPHVWHLGELWVPEARAALRDIADFVQTSFDRASR